MLIALHHFKNHYLINMSLHTMVRMKPWIDTQSHQQWEKWYTLMKKKKRDRGNACPLVWRGWWAIRWRWWTNELSHWPTIKHVRVSQAVDKVEKNNNLYQANKSEKNCPTQINKLKHYMSVRGRQRSRKQHAKWSQQENLILIMQANARMLFLNRIEEQISQTMIKEIQWGCETGY